MLETYCNFFVTILLLFHVMVKIALSKYIRGGLRMNRRIWSRTLSACTLVFAILATSACGNSAVNSNTTSGPIKVGILTSKTGALEAYGNQMIEGFEMGLDYATNGKREVNGRKIQLVVEDTETKPDVATKKATKLLEEDKVDLLTGCASSTDTLAVLPLLKDYKKIMVVEPSVADSITGADWNPYVFRTARNSSQDAIAGAAAIAKTGTKIAVLAPDNAFGHEGASAFIDAAKKKGASIVQQEFPDPKAADFTANIQKIVTAKPDYLFVIWAGANSPWKTIVNMKLAEKGIKISTGAPVSALKTMGPLVGMEGFCVYYNELPKNSVNQWLIDESKKRYNKVPDLFTAGGMNAAIAIVEGLKKAGTTDSATLIKTMEGMSFEGPKGKMTFRKEDHQALQPLYAVKLENRKGYNYPVPVLLRELSSEETAPPIKNKK